MTKPELTDSNIFKYEFEVPIKCPTEKVWAILTDNIDQWWMNDFRALGEGSVMSLSAKTGGSLLETGKNGDTLEWYRVQMCVGGQSLYLVGYLAPDWGGPTISMLKLALEADGETCLLKVSDGLLGNTSESAAKNAEDGWLQMFGDGLKAYAEAS